MNNMKTSGSFYDPRIGARTVTIGDHVIIGGDKAHVVGIGRKYVEILFYTDQPSRGRMKIDPLSDLAVWPGTAHY